ncbi:MAG: MerR family transcriptional regulator [Firmicutes bacterium]|nr:MerR family transcriptional regulator [Bacillota bacterium]
MPKTYWTIKEVAQQTGLSPQQLRKWEERYGVVRPQRLPNGYRGYSAADVARIQQMLQWIAAGMQVQEAARRVEESSEESIAIGVGDWRVWRQHFWEAGAMRQRRRVEEILENAINRFGIGLVITHIIRPGLAQVGEWWATSRWTPDQEQITSEACYRLLMNSWAAMAPIGPAPSALCVAPPGDRHSLPPLLLAVEARLLGWDAQILGASPAPGSILRTKAQWNPEWIAIVATTSKQDNPLLEPFMKDEAPQLQEHCQVFLGGLAAPKGIPHGIVALPTPNALLDRVGPAPAVLEASFRNTRVP